MNSPGEDFIVDQQHLSGQLDQVIPIRHRERRRKARAWKQRVHQCVNIFCTGLSECITSSVMDLFAELVHLSSWFEK